ncbi:BamA/TamA family outer membrane protein [Fodinibius sediminis]|nr:BamA/TamA family outer membrane protein [Fodinibius sediminis]
MMNDRNALTMGRSLFLAAVLMMLQACNASRPFYKSPVEDYRAAPEKDVEYSLFLIGDVGEPEQPRAADVLQTLQYQLLQASDSSSVVFLGDNIYPDGLPPDPRHKERISSENKLKPALDILNNYRGQAYFLPGNHDWWGYGIEGLRAQEDFVENFGSARVEFTPDEGCPGPSGFTLGKNWYMVVLDSEWWINQSLELGPAADSCGQQSRAEVIDQTATLIDANADKHILVAFHHPLYSNGSHGGFYPLRDHLFPLTNVVDNLYVPLPIVGSLYPLSRKLGLSRQDIPNRQYQAFKQEILEAAEDVENVFFASGHDHQLAFYIKDKPTADKEGQDFFILSGSGSKNSYARGRNGAEFVYSRRGFAKLLTYKDGSVAVEFWVPEENNQEGRLVYRKELIEPQRGTDFPAGPSGAQPDSESQMDSTVTIAAGPLYEAGDAKRFIWGDHYRDAWTTPVEVPVLNFQTEKGGLEVLARTGGVQTVTIIAEDPTGRRYVMRSVQKDPKRSLPEILQETFITDIAQDQTSATHPYGSMVASSLASAAGVYHTTPELRYIPGHTGFDIEAGDRNGTLVTVEEFVSKEWFNQTYGRNAVDMVGSHELWGRLRAGSSATIDERQLVRSRIFDMFIGDWDRHEKQWFWAETTTDSTAAYQPIPIDRDNAFYKSDGVILGLARLWAFPKFQYFGEDIQNIKGINLNAQYFDRWFINKLDRQEWIGIARQMQEALTDSVITQSVEQWPDPIAELNGPTFVRKLKARRDKLTDFARRYYDLLIRQINVFGSDEPEEFMVEHLPQGETLVSLYRQEEGKSRQLVYYRKIKAAETSEVRLYGFGGEDRFEVSGQGGQVKVRIIGGDGKDVIADSSEPAGSAKRTWVYDTKAGSLIETEKSVKNKTSSTPRVNRYDKRGFQYNFTGPLFTTGYNDNDGLFLGGGVLIRRQGFRKKPFASRHRIRAKTAMRTTAFSVSYDGIFTDVVGPYNIEIDAEVLAPNYSANYFGQGNETEKESDNDTFYGYRMDTIDFGIGLSNEIVELLTIRTAFGLEYYRPFEMETRFVASEDAGLANSVFNAHYLATVGAGFTINTVDSEIFPRYGMVLDFSYDWKIGLNDRSDTYGRISSEGTIYYTFEEITTTLASRIGFSTNIGSYQFFEANTLGGQSFSGETNNLRGFLRDRFSGRSAIFHNTELRTKLLNIQSYVLPATMGILAYVDEGRVWFNDEHSRKWHVNYGGGLWISPLNRIVLTGGLAFSKEETLLTLTLGFPF